MQLFWASSVLWWVVNRKIKHSKCVYRKDCFLCKELLSFANDCFLLHAKMKPFTDNCKKEYELPNICFFLLNSDVHYLKVKFTRV